MASRTNKQWIAKKKAQLQKLKMLKVWAKRRLKNKNLSEEEKIEKWLIFDMENPAWRKFSRDKSWRKIICLQTGMREDENGYRLIFKPNSSEVEYIYSGINARLRRKLKRRVTRG